MDTLTIVGVGLIGGSLGLAARQLRLARRVIGVGRQQKSLEAALRLGTIDEATIDMAAGLREAELVVFCTPVDLIVEQIRTAAQHCRPGTLLTDAGSTKTAIVRGLEGRLPEGVTFVGSHPLAGSEKRGPEFADAHLFRQRLTVVTPTETTPEQAVQQICDFWQALGSRVKLMSPEDHDRALALTSHLPHLLASTLAGILPEELFELTATGFRDTTRVAAGDPSIWTGIFQQNREAVLEALEQFIQRLKMFQQVLRSEDGTALAALLAQAKKVRDALGNRDSAQGKR